MLRGRLTPALLAAAFSTTVAVLSSAAREASSPSTLYEIPLPGGLESALSAIGDRAPADRSHFLLEFIRRLDDTPGTGKSRRDALLQAWLAHVGEAAGAGGPHDTLPLPLAPTLWIDKVFGGQVDERSLVAAILKSRNAALLYYGLLSLDEPTRSWLADDPALFEEIAAAHAPALVVVAPGFQVAAGVVQLPGGDAARDVWEALAGRPASEPAAFLRALLTQDQGRFGFFYSSLAQLSPPQLRLALGLDAADPARRIDSARRLLAVFGRITEPWSIADRPFWRPRLDPALLVSELRTDADGTPVLPGTRALWTAALDDLDRDRGRIEAAEAAALSGGEAVDLPWLADRIFTEGSVPPRRPYDMVLFASRVVRVVSAEAAADVLDAIRASALYPALTATLERAEITDPAIISAAARRARTLSQIGDVARQARAVGQFQASIVLVTRAALRKSLTSETLASLISSLSAVEPNDHGEYGGQLARWWERTIATHGNLAPTPDSPHVLIPYDDTLGSLDADLVRLIAGAVTPEPRLVDWEGTRYRLDLAWAESTRLAKALGERPRPYLSAALALLQLAETLGTPQVSWDLVTPQVSRAEQVLELVTWPGLDKAVAAVDRLTKGQAAARGRRAAIADTLTALADDLFARGLIELVYAVALGQPDRARLMASDAAARHDFGRKLFGQAGPWRFPMAGADRLRDWRVTGSLFAIDVRLAELSLMRVSLRPPLARPTLNEGDRRTFIETVALMEPSALSDSDRQTLVDAMRRGRERLSAAASNGDLMAIADEIRLIGPRRSLLGWVAVHDPGRLSTFLSPTELLWLGLESRPVDSRLHAWGAPGEPRLGCLCLRLSDRRPLEALGGRADSGMLASAFADLNLRLAELLAEMDMPAPLLPSVLAAATLDFVNTAVSRGQNDRRGLVEFVYALQPEQVELYLALLTTDGPLVPIGDTPEPTTTAAVPKREVSR